MNAQPTLMGFHGPIRALLIGGSGGIGSAFAEAIHNHHPHHTAWTTSRTPRADTQNAMHSVVDITNEESIEALVRDLKAADYTPNLIVDCTGILHTPEFGPEKTWRHLNIDTMREVFAVNTFGVALLGKHLLPILPRKERAVFATLSARVGSISDNRLGGWYSYRASKAAQNMMVKTLALEASRRWKELVCVSLHPGTVKTKLSDPFSSRVPPHKLFSAEQSVGYLIDVISKLEPEQSGGFFAWDGSAIEF